MCKVIIPGQLLGAPLSIQHTTLFFSAVVMVFPVGMVPLTMELRMPDRPE
jgi:hypothetical protein